LNWFEAFLQKIEIKTENRKKKTKRKSKKKNKRAAGTDSAQPKNRPEAQQRANPKGYLCLPSPDADALAPPVRPDPPVRSPSSLDRNHTGVTPEPAVTSPLKSPFIA
jgi:hypothetical protein